MIFFHEVAPEYIVGIHSLDITSAFAGIIRLLGFGLLIIPLITFHMWLSKKMGSQLSATIRDCPDNAHMLPGIIRYQQRKNFSNADDFLGRNNGMFYQTLNHEDFIQVSKLVTRLRQNGVMV